MKLYDVKVSATSVSETPKAEELADRITGLLEREGLSDLSVEVSDMIALDARTGGEIPAEEYARR
jgi:hypothetical protein